MYLKSLELSGFKSFAKKTVLDFNSRITGIVGPNGSGKSNVAEAFQFVLGEQSIKSLRGKRGEDLIFNGSKTIGRQNRGAVKVTLDNSKRLLNLDFDEVVFERVVHRDNNNEYLINGSAVRLKDVIELLAQAHMGPTGHHIISQGEADRILNANLKERRLMVEDALGLKSYQYKRAESERKLERTRENMSQVESLRRELAPHVKFLRKQVEKIEKAKELQKELVVLYREYLSYEHTYLDGEWQALHRDEKIPKEKLQILEKELTRAKAVLEKSLGHDNKSAHVLECEQTLRDLRTQKDELVRDAGRLEGALLSEQRRLKKQYDLAKVQESRTVPLKDVRNLTSEVEDKISRAERAGELSLMKAILSELKTLLVSFVKRFESLADLDTSADAEAEITRLKSEREVLQERIEGLMHKQSIAEAQYEKLRVDIEKEKDGGHDAEREIFKIVAEQNELRGEINLLKSREERLRMEQEEYARELKEAEVLVGPDVLKNVNNADESGEVSEQRSVQHERRRHLEKMKIRLEELGGGGSEEVLKEYQDAADRDTFLEREVGDLEQSAASLEQLIKELTERLDFEFREGVRKINTQFEEFFKLMFGGGHASLSVVRPEKRKRVDAEELLDEGTEAPAEEEVQEGIDISVNLPHKKAHSLEMLSGGERALTSIALLFAISQVNPPPFIVLDETDAALDEANSRKYGDMLEKLSKHSQLVVVTHNRETMSRAGVLYGVTMGQDGVSKLLSIQFEEAVKVAK